MVAVSKSAEDGLREGIGRRLSRQGAFKVGGQGFPFWAGRRLCDRTRVGQERGSEIEGVGGGVSMEGVSSLRTRQGFLSSLSKSAELKLPPRRAFGVVMLNPIFEGNHLWHWPLVLREIGEYQSAKGEDIGPHPPRLLRPAAGPAICVRGSIMNVEESLVAGRYDLALPISNSR